MESRITARTVQPASSKEEPRQIQSGSVPGETSMETDDNPPVMPAPISTSAVITESDEAAMKNQKLVEEFQYLLEKSQSLFAGLR
jgi:hypothetical protein